MLNLIEREREAKLEAIGKVLTELFGTSIRLRRVEENFLSAIEKVELDFMTAHYEANQANHDEAESDN